MENIVKKNKDIPCDVDICMCSNSYNIEVNGVSRNYCKEHMNELLSYINNQFRDISKDDEDCVDECEVVRNRIELSFNKDLSILVGKDFGSRVYSTQVKDFIDWDIENELIFSSQIKNVSISFVEGFIGEMLKEQNVHYILNHLKFIGGEDVVGKMLKSIFYIC